MLETVFLVIILSVIPMAKYPIRFGSGYTLKEHLFYLAGLAYLCKGVLFGGLCAVSMSGQLLFAYTLFGIVSILWATNSEQAWQDVPKWLAMYALFVMVSSVPVKTVMLLAVIPVLPFLAYGFMQDVYPRRDFLDKSMDDRCIDEANRKSGTPKSKFFGFIGNTNHASAFLAPYTFVCLWLAVNVSPWFYLLAGFNLFGLYRMKCLGALTGTAMGLCVAFPPYSLLGLIPIGLAVVSVLLCRKFKKEWYGRIVERTKDLTLWSRIYYAIVALKMWKKRPCLGYGLRGFRKEIYDVQAELKGKYSGLVTNEGRYLSYPTRAHNDLLESLCELGIAGFALMLGFLGTVVYGAISSGNYIILAGVVCLMVHGMFFYTMSTFSYVPYMMLTACASGSAVSPYSLPFAVGLILTAFLVTLGISYVIYPHLTTMWLARINGKPWDKQNRCVDSALVFDPSGGAALSAAIRIKAHVDPYMALHLAERAVHHYDGTMQAWGVWGIYGELMMKTGNWEGAKRALRYAVYLNPTFEAPQKILDEMEETERRMTEQREEQAKRMHQFQSLANGRAA